MDKIKIRVAKTIDHENAHIVEIVSMFGDRRHDVWTNSRGNGLWIDGQQVLGTSQFSARKNPQRAIRSYFSGLR